MKNNNKSDNQIQPSDYIKEIPYIVENNYSITTCKFIQISFIKVGSNFCKNCIFNKGINYNDNIVKCSFKK